MIFQKETILKYYIAPFLRFWCAADFGVKNYDINVSHLYILGLLFWSDHNYSSHAFYTSLLFFRNLFLH